MQQCSPALKESSSCGSTVLHAFTDDQSTPRPDLRLDFCPGDRIDLLDVISSLLGTVANNPATGIDRVVPLCGRPTQSFMKVLDPDCCGAIAIPELPTGSRAICSGVSSRSTSCQPSASRCRRLAWSWFCLRSINGLPYLVSVSSQELFSVLYSDISICMLHLEECLQVEHPNFTSNRVVELIWLLGFTGAQFQDQD